MQDDASATDHGDPTAAAQDWLFHRPVNSAVSLAEGVAELRFRCPHTALSDEALELLVAELALKRGLAIRFDRRPTPIAASSQGGGSQPPARWGSFVADASRSRADAGELPDALTPRETTLWFRAR